MKRIPIVYLCLLAALASCSKQNVTPAPSGDEDLVPIIFNVSGLDTEVETKTSELTELNTFNVLCTTGSAGSETSVWSIPSVNKNGMEYNTGKYWPITNPSYNFYASNVGMTFKSQGSVITPSGMDTDIVVAYRANAQYKTTNNLTFRHIFSRIGNVTVQSPEGYEAYDVSITITPRVANGTTTVYDIRNNTWSNAVDGSVQTICNVADATVLNDIWLVPGDYSLSATYSLRKGEWVDTAIKKTAPVNLQIGKVNNITCTLPAGNASEIVFNVTLEPWVQKSVTASFIYNG